MKFSWKLGLLVLISVAIIASFIAFLATRSKGIVNGGEIDGEDRGIQPEFPSFGCNSANLNDEQLHLCPCPNGQKVIEAEIPINPADGIHSVNSVRIPAGAEVISNTIIFKLKRENQNSLSAGVLELMYETQEGAGTVFGGYMLMINIRGRFSLRRIKSGFSEVFGKSTTKGVITDKNPTYAFVCSKYQGRVVVSVFYKGTNGWALIFQADNPFGIGHITGLGGFKYRNTAIASVQMESLKQCVHLV